MNERATPFGEGIEGKGAAPSRLSATGEWSARKKLRHRQATAALAGHVTLVKHPATQQLVQWVKGAAHIARVAGWSSRLYTERRLACRGPAVTGDTHYI